MQFSMRKFLGTSVIAAALAVTSFGGRPFIEAQQPLAAVQTGDLADLLAATAEAANVDYFLKLDGIDGESTDDRHKGEIEVLSWSWGATNAGAGATGGGGGAGKVSMQDFHFTASSSKASPQLFLSTATGKHHKEAVLVVRKGGKEQAEYYKVTMSDVLISSYSAAGSQGGELPTEEVSLNFAKIEFSYTPQGADGRAGTPVTACYDLKSNKVC